MSDVRRYQGDCPESDGMLPTAMIQLADFPDDDPALSMHFVGERIPDKDASPEPADSELSSDSIPTMPVDPADLVTAERAAVSQRGSDSSSRMSSPMATPSAAVSSSDEAGEQVEETVPLKPLSDTGVASAPVPPPPSFFPSNTTGRMRPITVPLRPQSRVVSGSSSFRPASSARSGAESGAVPGVERANRDAGAASGTPRVCYSSQYRVLHPAD